MRRYVLLALLAGAATLAGLVLYSQHRERGKQIEMPAATAFRILLGVNDREPTAWDGKVNVSGAKVLSIQGWRFADTDSSDYRSSWKASTRRGLPPVGARQRMLPGPLLENGVIIAVAPDVPEARFAVETAQGNFSFTPKEVTYQEPRTFLDGRVVVERVPATVQLTTSIEEQDFPAAAQTEDEVIVSYVEFTHGDRGRATEGPFREEPKDFDFLARPSGGDQVWLQRYSKTSRTWSAPVAVSAPGQDIDGTAIAVDGQKRVWVFWSANRGGNFDIYARSMQDGRWAEEVRLTTDPGTDLRPVAARDAKGRVWVAWQGFRNGSLDILAAAQQGNRFTREAVVSASPASDWDPSIAAGPNGEVAVSWDTYDKGDYDVYFRRLTLGREIRREPPVPVAASQNFEARSSIAYDSQNRLWVAYEASDIKWGKDFGAYETAGIALYQGHNLRVKCFQGSNAFAAGDDLRDALPGAPMGQIRRARRRRPPTPVPATLTQPNPELAARRAPSATPQPPPLPLNSFPRLAVDAGGTVYLAFRSVAGPSRSPVGTVWAENIVYFDGKEWSGPVAVPHTDYWLDTRPAVLMLGSGHLMMVAATDHRQSVITGGGRRAAGAINADIYAAEMRLDGQAQPAQLQPLPAETVAPAHPDVKPELEQVAFMRKYRAKLQGQELRLLRGEFHRHTEMSGDGGRDGPLIDAYRYMIDGAYMDWVGCCDHDNGGGREYSWWLQQKLTDAYKLGAQFIPMFSYERSVRYPEGHRNVVFAKRGVRPLPRLPKVPDDAPSAPAPDTQMLYRYLRQFDGIVAVHTSGTDMGTDWRDNDPLLEPVVEIYQGDRQNYEMPEAPRSNNEKDSIGGWRPLGFVSLALKKGYRLAFQASSDHISTHMSYCNLWVAEPTREGTLEAFKKRRVYGATENILADVRCGEHFMGEEFSVGEPPAISVKLWGTANFAKVHIIKDNEYVYTTEPHSRNVEFVWKDAAAVKGKTSYYYVRGEQSDGELVWVSPMWIAYQ